MTLAMLRLTRVAAANRRVDAPGRSRGSAPSGRCAGCSARSSISHTPIASTLRRRPGRRRGQRGAGRHPRPRRLRQADQRTTRSATLPTNQLLTGLRGKDVLLVFVEAYGQHAVQGSSFSPEVDAALAQGDKQLQTAGFSARSGFLTSATFGGISWLAHSTLQSGLWVDSQLRYDQLMSANRFTLADAFKRAGWRTVDDVPSNDRSWPQGTSFYHYDKLYDRLSRRLSRPDVHLRVDARPVHLLGAATPRARQDAPPPAVRGGRHGVEPHAVEPHPPADRLERGRQRLDLQPASRWTTRPARSGATRRGCRRRTAGRSCTR